MTPVQLDSPKRREVLPCALVTLVCVLAQLVLGGRVNILGATPNFLLCAVFFIALKAGPRPGVLAGFALGLLFDLLGSSTLGLSSLVGCVFGYACALLCRPGVLGEPLRASVRFLGCAFLFNAARYALMVFLGIQDGAGAAALGRIALTSLLDALVTLVVCLAYSWLSSRGRAGLRL